MINKKIIGILAGMGPRSTGPFIDLVIKQCQEQYGAKYDEEYPHMLIYSLPTPFYVDKPIDHSKMKKVVAGGLRKLEEMGVHFIAMPCNTVHAYYEELQGSIKIPLLNIVRETTNAIGDAKKVALLATRPTIDSGIYQKGFDTLTAQCVVKEQWKQAVDQLLTAIKSGEGDAGALWKKLLFSVREEGCDSAFVACTDLNVLPMSYDGLKLIDSAKCLAAAVIREYLR